MPLHDRNNQFRGARAMTCEIILGLLPISVGVLMLWNRERLSNWQFDYFKSRTPTLFMPSRVTFSRLTPAWPVSFYWSPVWPS